MKADIYKHVGTGTGPGIGLGSKSCSNLREPLILYIINNINKFRDQLVVHLICSRMEKEIPLIALAYIERLCTKVGILINHWNWRRIMLICLIIASKVWDDESLENIHFPKAMPDLSLKEINSLEKIFLELISYDLIVKGSDHAKYYFILRAMSKEFEEENDIQIDPLSYEEMKKLQKNADKAEEVLKEIYKCNQFAASI